MLDKCIEMGGAELIPPSLSQQLMKYYDENGQPQRILPLLQAYVKQNPKSLDAWMGMVLLYAQTGQVDKAEQAAQQAIAIDPSVKTDIDNFLQNLKNNPSQ
jgi:tetratricopeptide (TPR) repeat protein